MLPAPTVTVEVAAQVQADPQALYVAGVADRLAGRHTQAAERFEQVLAQRPTDVDARLNLGLSLLALDRVEEAEAAFRAVLDQAPGYADAEIGLARAAQRRGDRDTARDHATRAATLSPDREDITAFRRSLNDVDWRIDADASRSRLSAGLPDWTEARVGASLAVSGGWAVGGAVEGSERFGRKDVYLEGRVDRRFVGGDVYIAIGGTPQADYRPEVLVTGGGNIQVAPGIRATLDASAGRYATGSVESLHPGLMADLIRDRVGLAVRWINVWDETGQHREGYAARATWRVTEIFRLSIGHSDAPESSEGGVVDVVATSFAAAYDLTDRLSLRLGVIDEDRETYGRDEISLGIGWRF